MDGMTTIILFALARFVVPFGSFASVGELDRQG
jgi:hypothetical protein